jgi:hypothetical protein
VQSKNVELIEECNEGSQGVRVEFGEIFIKGYKISSKTNNFKRSLAHCGNYS